MKRDKTVKHWRENKTHRNGQLGGKVGCAGSGEDRVRTGKGVRLSGPNAREWVSVRVWSQTSFNVLNGKVQKIIDLVEEVSTVYLVHEIWFNHFIDPKFLRKEK